MTCLDADDARDADWRPVLAGAPPAVDDHALVEFTCGGCGAFAVALHDRTGWTIMAEFEPHMPDDVAHVWVEDPQGHAVDVQGVHQGSRAETRYSPTKPGRIAPLTRDEAADRDMGPGSYFEWANEVLDAHRERYGLSGPGTGPRR